jgi:hypothetical protein
MTGAMFADRIPESFEFANDGRLMIAAVKGSSQGNTGPATVGQLVRRIPGSGTRTLTSLNGAALNAPCDNVRRCQLGLSCSEANVCVVERLVPLGGTCDFSNRACDYGEAFCDFSAGGNTGICVALRGPNATCEGVYQCRSELTCKGPPGTTVCAPPSAVGGPCWYGQSSDACVIGTCCTATSTVMTGVCANRKGQGASCVEGSECQGACVNSMCTRPSCVDPTP